MVERRRDKGGKRERGGNWERVVAGCGKKRFEKNQKKGRELLVKGL